MWPLRLDRIVIGFCNKTRRVDRNWKLGVTKLFKLLD
jgi:hypothetical protein